MAGFIYGQPAVPSAWADWQTAVGLRTAPGTLSKVVSRHDGIGANNVGQQPFDIDKLTDQYDATGEYRRRWAPDSGNVKEQPLDSVDAADWPIGRRNRPIGYWK